MTARRGTFLNTGPCQPTSPRGLVFPGSAARVSKQTARSRAFMLARPRRRVISSTTPGKLTALRDLLWILRKEVARFDGMSDDAACARRTRRDSRPSPRLISRPKPARLSLILKLGPFRVLTTSTRATYKAGSSPLGGVAKPQVAEPTRYFRTPQPVQRLADRISAVFVPPSLVWPRSPLAAGG